MDQKLLDQEKQVCVHTGALGFWLGDDCMMHTHLPIY